MAEGKTLKLTRLGEHARDFGVTTPGAFWQNMLRMANQALDQDADWELLFDERIEGLKAMRDTIREKGSDWFKGVPIGGDAE